MKQHHEPAPFFSPIEWYVMAVVGGITVAMLGVNLWLTFLERST